MHAWIKQKLIFRVAMIVFFLPQFITHHHRRHGIYYNNSTSATGIYLANPEFIQIPTSQPQIWRGEKGRRVWQLLEDVFIHPRR